MKKHVIYIPILLTLLSIITASCDDDNLDDSKPVINLIEPTDGDTLYIGEEVHFECEFSDNTELKSYKIDIHDNLDDHSHEKSLNSITEGDEGHPWSYINSWEFESNKKNSDIHHHEIVIPDSVLGEEQVMEPVAHGEYHFSIYCTDASGNESKIIVEVILEKGEHEDEH